MNSLSRAKDIDLIKAIAIICVVFIHVGGIFYAFPVNSFEWNVTLFYGSIVRAGVPLFLMCSGALLLNPEKKLDIKRLYTHNIPRILAAMFFWGMAYKVWHMIFGAGITVSGLIQALKELLVFNQEFHFYYLHIILLVYVFLPVTRCFVASAPKRLVEYALVIWFAFGILYPTVNSFWPFTLLSGMTPQYLINMTYASIGYGVFGWYLKKYPISVKISAAAAILGFLTVFFGTYFLSLRYMYLNELFFSGMTVGTFMLASGIYGLCVKMGDKLPEPATIVSRFMSKASFCIYLVHMFAVYLLEGLGITSYGGPPIITIPVISFAVIAISVAVYAVISRIPVLKKWII